MHKANFISALLIPATFTGIIVLYLALSRHNVNAAIIAEFVRLEFVGVIVYWLLSVVVWSPIVAAYRKSAKRKQEWILRALDAYRNLGFFAQYQGLPIAEVLKKIDEQEREEWQSWGMKTEYVPGAWQNDIPQRGTPEDDLYILRYDRNRTWWDDTEMDVGAGNKIYEETLKEWARISRGAFNPQNINETWKSESGPIQVSFTLDGARHEFHPVYQGDWLDLTILEDVNALIVSTGYRFETYFPFDQSACIVVFTEQERDQMVRAGKWKMYGSPVSALGANCSRPRVRLRSFILILITAAIVVMLDWFVFYKPVLFSDNPQYSAEIASARSAWRDNQTSQIALYADNALQYARTDNEKATAYYWKGVGEYHELKFDIAEADAREAIRLQPDWSAPYVTLGAILNSKGDKVAAWPIARKALELGPNYAWAHNLIGIFLLEEGRAPEAIPYFKKAIQLDPMQSTFSSNLKNAEQQPDQQ